MTFSINGKQLQYTAKDFFNALDAKDGSDGMIKKNVWDGFAQIARGNTVKFGIMEENAVKSISAYFRRSNDDVKAEMLKYMGLEINGSSEKTETATPKAQDNNTQTAQKPAEKKEVAKKTTPVTTNPVEKKDAAKSSTPAETKPKAPVVQTNPFDDSTITMNNLKIEHDTTILDVAQNSLGLYEVSYKEYLQLKKENPEELQNTQYRVIGNYGSVTDAWCAHTVSYLAREAGMDIGAHKKSVYEFIQWAGTDYKRIKTHMMTTDNYISERESRAEQIKEQLPNMKEGDFIIWKANGTNLGTYLVETNSDNMKACHSSHIGIIEKVDLKNGIVTVIEGNANRPITNNGLDRALVTKPSEGINGSQGVGEFQESNRRDGLIRKQYTIEELAAFGYTGYIDNSSRVISNKA